MVFLQSTRRTFMTDLERLIMSNNDVEGGACKTSAGLRWW